MSDRENIEGIIKELEQQLASAQEESRQSESEEESKLLKAKTEETIKKLQQLMPALAGAVYPMLGVWTSTISVLRYDTPYARSNYQHEAKSLDAMHSFF